MCKQQCGSARAGPAADGDCAPATGRGGGHRCSTFLASYRCGTVPCLGCLYTLHHHGQVRDCRHNPPACTHACTQHNAASLKRRPTQQWVYSLVIKQVTVTAHQQQETARTCLPCALFQTPPPTPIVDSRAQWQQQPSLNSAVAGRVWPVYSQLARPSPPPCSPSACAAEGAAMQPAGRHRGKARGGRRPMPPGPHPPPPHAHTHTRESGGCASRHAYRHRLCVQPGATQEMKLPH